MKNIAKIIAISLCLVMLILSAAACGGQKKDYDDYEDPMTNVPGNDNTDFVTAPSDTENDGYMGNVPQNNEPGWGPIIPR